MLRFLLPLLLLVATPVAAQPVPAAAIPAPIPAVWDPVGPYIAAGQDEPGYRSWYIAAPWRAAQVQSFHDYLARYGVAGIVPTWQLLRTATSWSRCGSDAFEIPPPSDWPHIVQTLRYINAYVIPAIGPVEPVSGYRNPHLNSCSGGAPASAHKDYSAIDLVPLKPTTRENLMRTLCAVHSRRGTDYEVGLGFYSFLRFHVDTSKFRRWGSAAGSADCPPIIRPADLATVALPLPSQPPPDAAGTSVQQVSQPQPQRQ